MLPFDLSRLRSHGDQTAPALFGTETRSTTPASAEEGFAGSEFRGVGFKVTTPLFARIEIKELRVGVVARRHPVVAAVHAGPDRIIAFSSRLLSRVDNRTALFINLLRPGLLYVLFGQQEFARYTVEDIMESVAAGHDHQLTRPPANRRIEQDRNLRGVPIMRVVRSKLEMPFQLSGVHIQGEQRAGIQIITGANVAVVIRSGIARAPVDQVQFRIIGTGDPGRGSAVLPRIASPGLRARFARRRNRPEAP